MIKLYYDLGFSFTPLNGKVPTLKGWPSAPRASLQQVEAWAVAGNIGLRTGAPSGVIVVDIEAGSDVSGLLLPPTAEVRTGSGGRHLYYRATKPCRNRVRISGKSVDIRGDGGQVVFPGSIHPTTGQVYEWVTDPLTVPMADAPEWVYNPPKETISNYARTALRQECDAVKNAPNGTRNDRLNQAAFSIGTLLNTLDERLARADLAAAARIAGLSEQEAEATINSGIQAGRQHPRPAQIQVVTAFTDVGNGHRFAAKFKDDLLFVPGWGWMLWDAPIWRKINNINEYSKQIPAALLAEAAEYLKKASATSDEDERTRLTKLSEALSSFARKSESRRGIGVPSEARLRPIEGSVAKRHLDMPRLALQNRCAVL